MAVATGAAAVAGYPAGGVLAGGGLIGLSIAVYSIGLRAVIGWGRPRLAIGLLFVKLLAFLGLGWLAFTLGREHRPDPIGFAVGLTCFPVAAVWEAMRVRGS